MSEYDVAVVGAGTAGLTAAKHAAAGGARVVVLDSMGVGGQVLTVEGITNFPGRPEPIAGYDLGAELMEEAETAGAEVLLAEITGITQDHDRFLLEGDDEPVRAGAVVLAGGSARRALGVPGEEKLDGRGVSHCASCDGPFFRDRRVVVVGGGDSALDEAQILATLASEVLVVHDRAELTADPAIVRRAAEHANIGYRARSTVSAVHGEQRVESVTIRDLDGGTETDEPADGLFVYIGLDPNTAWLDGFVDLTGTGHVGVDAALQTSRPGVFAAGDVRDGSAAMLHECVDDGERVAAEVLTHLAATAGSDAERSRMI
ncbi:thioredoxin-disulfide reductase [Georgenia halophila]|uniref:Thioredoxin-disulfide reductase n=1 Tax=Georgenia halophila TaxID=620889 RepID=A0ABP8LKD0_9MICO